MVHRAKSLRLLPASNPLTASADVRAGFYEFAAGVNTADARQTLLAQAFGKFSRLRGLRDVLAERFKRQPASPPPAPASPPPPDQWPGSGPPLVPQPPEKVSIDPEWDAWFDKTPDFEADDKTFALIRAGRNSIVDTHPTPC